MARARSVVTDDGFDAQKRSSVTTEIRGVDSVVTDDGFPAAKR